MRKYYRYRNGDVFDYNVRVHAPLEPSAYQPVLVLSDQRDEEVVAFSRNLMARIKRSTQEKPVELSTAEMLRYVQDAIRETLTPTMEEPTQLGAIVSAEFDPGDKVGKILWDRSRWVCVGNGYWVHEANLRTTRWHRLISPEPVRDGIE